MLAFVAYLLVAVGTRPANADEDKSGVSPSRLKLPKGPGSIEGIGENAEPNLSMGLMSYGVPIQLPSGYSQSTPSLRLAYSSGAGNSEVGLGWSLSIPSIERMTSKGLPKYDRSDTFATGGSDELVLIDDAAGVYRARYEASFVRYTWVDPERAGKQGYFRAEYPDGRIGYFGARADGTPEQNARVQGPNGVFRYQLVETVDTLGHAIRYEYGATGGYPTLRRIAYAFQKDGKDDPRYEVRLSYEPRPDEISDARPGFDLRLSERLTAIQVLVRGVQLRRYALNYHTPTARTSLSRLAHVEQFGANDKGPYPIDFRFDYTGTTAAPCSGAGCDSPELIAIPESVEADFANGKADLFDINGDGLPDILDTSQARHRFYFNTLGINGVVAWSAEQETNLPVGWSLKQASVQPIDLDGNGFTDLVDTSAGEGAGEVLWNRGGGDWDSKQPLDHLGLPDFSLAQNLRFVDYDNDKRPDLLYNDGSSAFVYANQGDFSFVERHDIQPLGQSFDSLQLADMNGDGMQDAVQMAFGLVAYKLNLGFGNWSGWIEMSEVPEVASGSVRLADINGDGLSDILTIFSDQVSYALNRNGRAFAAPVAVPVGNTPSDTSVRLADLNGSGSVDVVWITRDGHVSYLELFRVRPNLLRRITTGAGKVIEAEYGSSIRHMVQAAANRDPWLHPLPNPTGTVDSLTTYDTLTRVRQTRHFEYRDGYYDGTEKQFRGFEAVTVRAEGETVRDPDNVTVRTEEGTTTSLFEVGRDDPYRKALLRRQIVRSGERVLREEAHGFDDCPIEDPSRKKLGQNGDTPVEIRFICERSMDTIVTEGSSEDTSLRALYRYHEVTLNEEYTYDAYGNRTRTIKRGVTSIDGGACECIRDESIFGSPCGSGCLGDESIEETQFVPPSTTNGRWLLNKPYQVRRFGREGGSLHTETRFFYDDPPFEGMPLGQVSRGLLTRTESLVNEGEVVSTERVQHDGHGTPLEIRDGRGSRRRFSYDPTGLFLLSEEVLFDQTTEPPYSLLMTASYHPLYEAITEASGWMLMVGGETSSPERKTFFDYDAFARLTKIAQPGDSLDLPTETFVYEIGSSGSRIVRRARSRSAGELDVAEVQCFDGLGRKYQTRSKIEGSRYQVSGFTAYDLQGNLRREYQPYVAVSGDCDSLPPAGVLSTRTSYDGTGRAVEVTYPDASIYGEPSVSRTRYEPLAIVAYDAEDTAPGPHKDTPEVTIRDGLDRTTGIERHLKREDAMHTELTYDELGNLRGYVQEADGERIEKVQTYDLLGRVKNVDDPDSGLRTFAYDEAGNVILEQNKEHTIRSTYDEANRLVQQWERGKPKTAIKYTYDRLDDCERCTHLEGQFARVTFPLEAEQGEDLMGYDARGQVVYNRRKLDGHTFELSTELDNLGRVVARVYPTGTRIERQIDGLGRLIAVPGYIPKLTYESRGPPATMSFANGVKTTQTYDELTRLKRLETKTSGGTIVQAYTYKRDRVGNILGIDDASELGGGPSANATYDYDSWYRLAAAHLDVGRLAEEHLDFGYDAFDRIRHKTSSAGAASPDHAGDYTYDRADGAGPHAVTATATRNGETRYRYDRAGNMHQGAGDAYQWDFLGRLTSSQRGNKVLGTYAYGPDVNRIRKDEGGHVTYYVAPDFEVRDGVATAFTLIGDQRVASSVLRGYGATTLGDWAPGTLSGGVFLSKPDGILTAGDAWVFRGARLGTLPTLTQPEGDLTVQLLSSSARDALAETIEAHTFIHHDHVGSEVAFSDAHGDIIERTALYPFGLTRFSNSAAPADFSFSGKERDASGATYFGSRYYAARIGRWFSSDPALATLRDTPAPRLLEGVGCYQFVRNSPGRFRDPDGRESRIDRFLGIDDHDKRFASDVVAGLEKAHAGGHTADALWEGLNDAQVQKSLGFLSTWGLLAAGEIEGSIAIARAVKVGGYIKLMNQYVDLSAAIVDSDKGKAGKVLASWAGKALFEDYGDTASKVLKIGSSATSSLIFSEGARDVATAKMLAVDAPLKMIRGLAPLNPVNIRREVRSAAQRALESISRQPSRTDTGGLTPCACIRG
ncbi:MAG TPA: toxin TcdB middle/N-terminal domain-containing protein [Polyangiaceae bacterium]|nr:toxin TcdB middle/N-terminal domain-containing protein [Polyangiaceae bacterium]